LHASRLGDFGEATNEYNRAIAINPSYGIAWYNLGVSYESKATSEGTDGVPPGRGALAGFSRYATEYRAGALQSGQKAEARQRWQKALTMGNPIVAAKAEENLAHSR
jgi:tetratricopeptide (TPR) repeat protein